MQLQLFPDPAPDSCWFVCFFAAWTWGVGGVVVGEVGRGGGCCGGEVGRNREQNVLEFGSSD